ncbi:unnamed protein product [Closterium sp. NIES-53]
MVHQVLQRLGFQLSSPQPTPMSTDHSLSAPPSDESVELSGPYRELVSCLMYLMTCTRPYLAYPLSLLARYVAPSRNQKVHWDAAKRVLRNFCSTSGMRLVLGGRGLVVLTGHANTSWVDDSATQRSSQGYTFSLDSGSLSWRSTRSSSVLSSSYEVEIYAGAMAAQELRWLTYLLTDLGEQPHSPPILYVDNKPMIALCQEHRLEHRTKHIALRYFLARELQQRGQLCLAYVATRANTAYIFTKALAPGDHQRFSTVLGLIVMDAEMASRKSTGTYVDAVPRPRANIVDGMWIFKGSLPEEIWLRRPPGFTGSFPTPLGFAPSTSDPSLFLRTDTSLTLFYVLVYVDNLVFATANTEALALVKSELQERHTCTDLGPSALRLPVLLATIHFSAYRSLTLSSTFGRVCRAEWPVSRACGLL